MKVRQHLENGWRDALISTLLLVLSFLLYLRTLAPSVAFLFDDTLEFQYTVPRLGILHPTGYPFYTLLGKLFTLIVPLNDPAFRLNLLSALNGALAVAMLYIVLRHLTAHRVAAMVGAATFAVGQTFWSQAVVAETYTTQMLFNAVLLYLTLTWREQVEQGNPASERRRLYALAFTMGLGLTHHRLILLLYPAIALYVALVDRPILRDRKTLSRALVLFIAPLLLYLYLPLRGNIGSADGTYVNTIPGFISWVTGSAYTRFLYDNPLQVQHDLAYYASLFNDQFTVVGLALAALGLVWLVQRPREWTLLAVALAAEAGFAFSYRTANVYVHFMTTFFLLAIYVGAGADAILTVFSKIDSRDASPQRAERSGLGWSILAVLLLFLIPVNLLIANYSTNDLSQKWDTHDYGLDILSQPLEPNATLVGILGEMTLVRYLQQTNGIRPDLQTIAADKEDARLDAIATATKQDRIVYLTRPLKGVAAKYSLSSLGPLIRVRSRPATTVPKVTHPLDEDFGAVKLAGYDVQASRNSISNGEHGGRSLRVTLYWLVEERSEVDAMVSIKVLRSDQRVLGQIDRRPVLDAYSTNYWRAGEVIADTYDVPIFAGATPGEQILNVTMYDAGSGTVIGQKDLQQVMLVPDTAVLRRDRWNIAHAADADFGTFSLAGYSLEASAPIRPGDFLPLTLLWRTSTLKPPDSLQTRIWLEDASGKQVTSRDSILSIGYPPFLWTSGILVRDWPSIRIPANMADGRYFAKLAIARNNQLLGSTLLPFQATVVNLGLMEIRNRLRTMTAPQVPHAVEATFENKIKLLGYDWKIDRQPYAGQVTLYWLGLEMMDTPYTVFVHLLDSKNKTVASGDAMPGNGDLPTTGWIENEFITDVHTLALSDVSAGTLQVEVGLYDQSTGTRLKTKDGQDSLILLSIDIAP